MSWLSTPASDDVEYGIVPGQSYKPILKKRTASGSAKLSESSLASISAVRTIKSRIDDLVRQHDEYAKQTFKYYCDAYERRMGKPWSSRASDAASTVSGTQNIQTSALEPPLLKKSLTFPTTNEPHLPAVVRANTLALEPSLTETSRTPLTHGQNISSTVIDLPRERQKKLDAMMDARRRAQAEWVLAIDPDQKRELYEKYLQAKDERKKFKASVATQRQEDVPDEDEDSDMNMQETFISSHSTHLGTGSASAVSGAQLPFVPQDPRRRASITFRNAATAPFEMPEPLQQQDLAAGGRFATDTSTPNVSATVPSKPTVDPRKRPSVSIGRPMNAGRPNLPKLSTNVLSPGTGTQSSTTSIPATPTTDPRRRPATSSSAVTLQMPTIGSDNVVTPVSGTEALVMTPGVDRARDPRRRPG